MIGGAAMDQFFLPGTIRDRIKDLMKSKKNDASRVGYSYRNGRKHTEPFHQW